MNWKNLRAFIPIKRIREPAPVVGVVRLSGIIGQLGPVRRGLTLAGLAGSLERAFKLRRLKAVALCVNSPGGSPVQSALIARRIRDLADEKGIPVFAFAEDVAASGGYWLASAADEIYADENSIIGSVGVVSAGFGFPELLKRAGIERRLYTAGDRKAMLDPFLAEKPRDVARLKAIQGDMHKAFKTQVKASRAGKLKAKERDLFSGEFWTGRRALEMGLIDGVGDMRAILRDRFGENVKLRLVADKRPWWRQRAGFGLELGVARPADWAAGALAAVEERWLWGRFGL